uniref:Uncharacterized protein n=1 Tax=Meloidogyne incognita TaxID=6306 RepID=A0A914KK98_MELIC
MSKSYYWAPDVYARWLDVSICNCGTNNFYTTKIRWIEVPMMSESDKTGIKTARWFGGILTLGLSELIGAAVVGGFYDHTHECVEIDFKCNYCEKTFKRTYEIISADIGNSALWGYYRKEYQCERSCSTRRSFEFVESKYRKIWSNYSIAGGLHCKEWSKDFYWKIN